MWRYSATDALASPEVPAVDVFRDVISKSEKALNKTPCRAVFSIPSIPTSQSGRAGSVQND